MRATPSEFDKAVAAEVERIKEKPPRYRCPECGSVDLRSDAAAWYAMNPNTSEIISDGGEVELAENGNPYTFCQGETEDGECCDFEGDLEDFEATTTEATS